MNSLKDVLFQVTRTLAARFHYMLGVTHRYLGSAHGMVREYESAIDCFDRAIRLSPEFAQAYLDRGILYWREMDHPRRAIHDLTIALDLDPTLVEARFNRGVAHQQLREYAEAIEDFEAYLAVGEHPYWREHAESMIRELSEWVVNAESVS
jgi:tetratricopeptide (TPR) repeat protein